jgi:hypothetical protein
VSSSKPVSKHKRTTSSAAENPKTKQQKQETVRDEDEIRGTGKGRAERGRRMKRSHKKARKIGMLF